MRRGKSRDRAVEEAYLRRITGYEVTEEKREFKIGEDGREELVKKTETVKHVPGDVRAAEFWLTNRLPEQWRPTRLLGVGGEEEAEGGIVELPQVDTPAPEAPEGEDGDG